MNFGDAMEALNSVDGIDLMEQEQLKYLIGSNEEYRFKSDQHIYNDEGFQMRLMEECLSDAFMDRADLLQVLKCPMKGLNRESHILSDFGFITFICTELNLQITAQNVCNFEFQRKAVTIFQGAHVKKTVNHSQWEKNCQTYVRKFYTKGERFVEAILVPDFTKKEEPHEILWNKVINLEIIKQWCSLSNNDLGLIIPNYNIVHHFDFYDISKSHLQKALNIKSIHLDNNRLLIFNASSKLLVVIRVASETQLKEEIDYCIIDISMLLLMFRDELEGSGVVVTGLVVYLGNNLHLESLCSKCQHFIVTKEVFESLENINDFWNEYKAQNIFEKIKTKLPKGDKGKEFMAISGKVIPYLASYQYRVCERQLLPTLEEDATKNIVQAELLLDRYQMEIAHSMENCIILKGDYGTGKTIIFLKKIEILSSVVRDRESIYYINFQGRSELDRVVSKKIKGFPQRINVLNGDSTLSNIIKSKILPIEEKAGTKMAHLFVDEYNTESLMKEEVSAIAKLLSEKELFKMSKIWLAIQPIEMKRKDFHFISGEESEYCENGNMLRELEKIMTVKRLQHVMRTTVEINSLIKVTQEYLNEKSNQYTRNVKSRERLSEDEVTQNKDFNIHENLLEDAAATVNLISKANHHKGEFLERDYKKNSENAQLDLAQIGSNSNSNFKQFEIEKTLDFDELHKLTSTEVKDNSENCQKRETTYRYHYQSVIGHNISGPLPNLVNLTYFDQNEICQVFASLFQLFEIKAKRTVFIHFEHDNPRWLLCLLKLSIFSSLSIVDDVDDFFSDNNEGVVLVKNYNCVRGIEFSDVILILDANEYHLKQFIPEAMARCLCNLSIIIKPAENGKDRQDSVMDLMEYWENVNQEEEEKKFIRILKLQFCKCTSTTACSSRAGYKNQDYQKVRGENASACYKIHKNCQSYKKMSEEIKDKIVLNKSLDKSGKNAAGELMDAHFRKSKSKMFKEMEEDYFERISEKYGTPDNCDPNNEVKMKNIPADDELRNNDFMRLEKIGVDAFASIYRCRNKYNGFEMALREVYTRSPHKRLPQQVKALYQEMQVLRKLKHKHIVKCYGILRANDSLSLLMEYVRGGSIHRLILSQGALQEKDTSTFCQQILEGLVYLHENKIVHRDLKGINILLDDCNNCKLAGFSVSKHGENITSTSGCNEPCGTAYWMSPESIQCKEYGWKSDIWSFGCTVLEMLNTKPPYREMNKPSALSKIANEDLIPSFPPDTSDHCMVFVKNCLQKEPQLRASAKDLLGYKFISVYSEF